MSPFRVLPVLFSSLLIAVPERPQQPFRIVGASAKINWQAVLDNHVADRKMETGVAFNIQVATEDDVFRLSWKMRYDGPRPPFVVLKPSLDGDYDHTQLRVFFRRTEGTVYSLLVMAPNSKYDPQKAEASSKPLNVAKRSSFLTAEKGEALEGEIIVSREKLKSLFQRQWSEQVEPGLRLLAIQLIHTPMDRGEKYDLDAWTGYLVSEIVVFKEKRKGEVFKDK